jgi:hypothetical protein
MDNTELFKNLKTLVHVDLEQWTNNNANKLVQPYKVGYYDAQRKLYDDLLVMVKMIDQEKLNARKIELAISYLNNLQGYHVYKQNLNTKQPYLMKKENSNLADFHSAEDILQIAKQKGWQEPDLIPEGFE